MKLINRSGEFCIKFILTQGKLAQLPYEYESPPNLSSALQGLNTTQQHAATPRFVPDIIYIPRSTFPFVAIKYRILDHSKLLCRSQVLRQELLDSKETTTRSDHLNKAVKEKLARDKGGHELFNSFSVSFDLSNKDRVVDLLAEQCYLILNLKLQRRESPISMSAKSYLRSGAQSCGGCPIM